MGTLGLILTVGGIVVGVAIALIIYFVTESRRKKEREEDEIRSGREREASQRQIETLTEEIRMLKEGQREFGIYLNGIPEVREQKKVILYTVGLRAMREYRHADAIAKFKKVLNLETDDSKRCVLLNLIGLSQETKGDTHDAEQTFLEMIRIAEKAGIEEALSAAYGNFGLVYRTLGEPRKALDYHQKALEINEKIGRLEGQANQLGNIGLVHKILGEPGKALEYHKKSLKIAKKIGNLEVQAHDLNNIAAVYFDLGQFKEALSNLQRAREIFAKIGAKDKVKICDDNIARAKKRIREGG